MCKTRDRPYAVYIAIGEVQPNDVNSGTLLRWPPGAVRFDRDVISITRSISMVLTLASLRASLTPKKPGGNRAIIEGLPLHQIQTHVKYKLNVILKYFTFLVYY